MEADGPHTPRVRLGYVFQKAAEGTRWSGGAGVHWLLIDS